jgi:type VI secretion system protein ImpH
MATAGRRQTATLIETLRRHPGRFDFFQAVRILRWWSHDRVRTLPNPPLRICVPPSLAFPPSAISALRLPAQGSPEAPELAVTFLGLTGPSGVLPPHYTDLVARRARAKDTALRDFLDLFHDRLALLFHAVWEKYRLLFRWERAAREGRTDDPFTQAILALVGMEPPSVRRRLAFPDVRLLYFAAHFARLPRSAPVLADMIAHVLGVTVTIEQFRGTWLELEPAEQTRLKITGGNCRLGHDAMAGARVWSVASAFRIRIGPLDYPDYIRLLPIGDRLEEVRQMVALYAPPELAFDLQLVLSGHAVPECRLATGGPAHAPRLGWSAWLRGKPSRVEAADAVFAG